MQCAMCSVLCTLFSLYISFCCVLKKQKKACVCVCIRFFLHFFVRSLRFLCIFAPRHSRPLLALSHLLSVSLSLPGLQRYIKSVQYQRLCIYIIVIPDSKHIELHQCSGSSPLLVVVFFLSFSAIYTKKMLNVMMNLVFVSLLHSHRYHYYSCTIAPLHGWRIRFDTSFIIVLIVQLQHLRFVLLCMCVYNCFKTTTKILFSIVLFFGHNLHVLRCRWTFTFFFHSCIRFLFDIFSFHFGSLHENTNRKRKITRKNEEMIESFSTDASHNRQLELTK